MIKLVATTIADAVRLAVADGVGDFWRNRIEDGSLKTGYIRNELYANDPIYRGQIIREQAWKRRYA